MPNIVGASKTRAAHSSNVDHLDHSPSQPFFIFSVEETMYSPRNNDFGKRARAARTVLGLTQTEAAKEIGITVEVYARIERGVLIPSTHTTLRITQALHMNAGHLLYGTASIPSA